jgi:hypothetical protein
MKGKRTEEQTAAVDERAKLIESSFTIDNRELQKILEKAKGIANYKGAGHYNATSIDLAKLVLKHLDWESEG